MSVWNPTDGRSDVAVLAQLDIEWAMNLDDKQIKIYKAARGAIE